MRWYPSKIDWWLGLVLAVAPIACLLGAFATIRAGQGLFVSLGGVAFIAAIYGGLVFPMRYGLDDDTLVVRFGLVRVGIALADITEVRPTRNPLSSPALSLDRLRIAYGTKSIMISPADREAFLSDLSTRAKLRRTGDTLTR
jgi:hypothetical protein